MLGFVWLNFLSSARDALTALHSGLKFGGLFWALIPGGREFAKTPGMSTQSVRGQLFWKLIPVFETYSCCVSKELNHERRYKLRR